VVLKITYQASPRQTSPVVISGSGYGCPASVTAQ
jgi:hypothetical protein